MPYWQLKTDHRKSRWSVDRSILKQIVKGHHFPSSLPRTSATMSRKRAAKCNFSPFYFSNIDFSQKEVRGRRIIYFSIRHQKLPVSKYWHLTDVSVYCKTLFLFNHCNSINLHLTYWCAVFRPDVLHFSERKQNKTKVNPNLTKTAVEIPLFLKWNIIALCCIT